MKKLFILILVTLSMTAMAAESLKPANCAATQASQAREFGKKIAQQPADLTPAPQKVIQVNVE